MAVCWAACRRSPIEDGPGLARAGGPRSLVTMLLAPALALTTCVACSDDAPSGPAGLDASSGVDSGPRPDGSPAGDAETPSDAGRDAGTPITPGTANLWVSPTPGGSCVRSATHVAFDQATSCETFGAAWSAAEPGDIIVVRAGTYGPQTLSGDKTSETSILAEDGTTLTGSLHADGDFATVANLLIDIGGDRGGQDSGFGVEGDNVTFRDVRVHGAYASVSVRGASFLWQRGELGQSGVTPGVRDCSDGEPMWIEASASGATIDGITFYPGDGDSTPGVCGSVNGVHIETIRIQETQDVTIRNCFFVDGSGVAENGEGSGKIFITSTMPSATAGAGFRAENNVFQPVNGSYAIQVHSNVTSCAWTLAYNTWYQPVSFACDDSSATWVGNLGVYPGCSGTHTANLWQWPDAIDCGTDDRVDGERYGVDALGLDATGRLTGGSPAIDAAETAGGGDYCTHDLGAIDIDGNERPRGAACDTGASER